MNRNLGTVLTGGYKVERHTPLYQDEITRAEFENIVRQRRLRLPVSKGKNAEQAPFPSGVVSGGSGGGCKGSRGGRRGSNRNKDRSRNKGSADEGTSQGSEGSEGSNHPPAPKPRTIR